ERLPGGRAAAGGDARHVRSVQTTFDRARRGRAGAELLGRSIRTCRLADPGLRRREARFGDDFAREERVVRIDARVEDRDDRAAAVVAGVPGLVSLDERHAL